MELVKPKVIAVKGLLSSAKYNVKLTDIGPQHFDADNIITLLVENKRHQINNFDYKYAVCLGRLIP